MVVRAAVRGCGHSLLTLLAVTTAALVLLLLCVVPPSTAQYNATAYIPFLAPLGVCVDRTGAVYVADPGNQRVVRVSSLGQLLGTFTTSNPALDLAGGVALNNDNSVLYVADQNNNRVVALDTQSGALLFTFQGATLNSPYQSVVDEYDDVYVSDNNRVWMFNSSGALQISYSSPPDSVAFAMLQGVAVSSMGQTVYVADTASDVVVVVDAASGSALSVLQTSSGPLLRSPSGLAYSDALDVLYVADTGNNRMVQFNLSSQKAAAWNVTLLSPRGIAVDAHETVYVTESDNNRVTVLAADGQQATYLYGDNGLGLGQDGSEGVAFDSAGSLYVSDSLNDRSATTENHTTLSARSIKTRPLSRSRAHAACVLLRALCGRQSSEAFC